jgi:hypothetical protein
VDLSVATVESINFEIAATCASGTPSPTDAAAVTAPKTKDFFVAPLPGPIAASTAATPEMTLGRYFRNAANALAKLFIF